MNTPTDKNKNQKKSVTFQTDEEKNHILESINKPSEKSKFSLLNDHLLAKKEQMNALDKQNNELGAIDMNSKKNSTVPENQPPAGLIKKESKLIDFKPDTKQQENAVNTSINIFTAQQKQPEQKPAENTSFLKATSLFSNLRRDQSKIISEGGDKPQDGGNVSLIPSSKSEEFLRQISSMPVTQNNDNYYRIGELNIKKGWLSNQNKLEYESGIINAFYLIDLKKNVKRVLVNKLVIIYSSCAKPMKK
jgi:hypothetical protein